MARKKLTRNQEKFWNRLAGRHNHRIREQLELMLKSKSISRDEHRFLVDRSYGLSEAEMWRLIIDHIRISTMQDFDQGVYKRPRKRRKKKQRL